MQLCSHNTAATVTLLVIHLSKIFRFFNLNDFSYSIETQIFHRRNLVVAWFQLGFNYFECRSISRVLAFCLHTRLQATNNEA